MLTAAKKPGPQAKDPDAAFWQRLVSSGTELGLEMPGTVSIYVIAAGDVAVKIGISKSPGQRLRSLQTGQDRPVSVFWSAILKNRKDAQRLEAAIHAKLLGTGVHAHGEWYYMAPETAVEAVRRVIEAGSHRVFADLGYGHGRGF